MLIDEQGKMHSEGPDNGAAVTLASSGALRQINTMLQSHSLILVMSGTGDKVWVESVSTGQPVSTSIVTGFESDPAGAPGPAPVRRSRGTVEWGVVGDDGQIPLPKGYVIKDNETIEDERFVVFADPLHPEAPVFKIPEADVALVQFVVEA